DSTSQANPPDPRCRKQNAADDHQDEHAHLRNLSKHRCQRSERLYPQHLLIDPCFHLFKLAGAAPLTVRVLRTMQKPGDPHCASVSKTLARTVYQVPVLWNLGSFV